MVRLSCQNRWGHATHAYPATAFMFALWVIAHKIIQNRISESGIFKKFEKNI